MADLELDAAFDALCDDSQGAAHSLKQEALDQFKAAFGQDATLLDACLELRMACNGAGDPLLPGEKPKMLAALRARLNTWSPSLSSNRARFDAAVRELVTATLLEVTS